MSFETYFETHEELVYTNVGRSMLPLLRQNRDLFIVKRKGPQRCRKYDVVLFHRQDGKYILHRIVEVREKDYVTLGDNCIQREYGIREEDILGVMTGFVRGKRQYRVDTPGFWLYSRIICWSYPVRVVLKKLKRLLFPRKPEETL